MPPQTTPSLQQSLSALPQEIYDQILHHVTTYDTTHADPITGLTTRPITRHYKFPIQFHINRHLRKFFAREYFLKSFFPLSDIVGIKFGSRCSPAENHIEQKWLASLAEEHFELLIDIRTGSESFPTRRIMEDWMRSARE